MKYRSLAIDITLFAVAMTLIIYAVLPMVGINPPVFATTVRGGSMEPTMRDFDTVFISTTHDIKVGDIIAFKVPTNIPNYQFYESRNVSYICHRVVDTVNGSYITQGDANLVPESFLIPDSCVIGKVIAIVPHGILIVFVIYVTFFALYVAYIMARIAKKYGLTDE